jgi:uncharacterized protein
MAKIADSFPNRVRIIENLWIPMPDGVRLAAKVWLAEGTGPVPAVLELIPYRKREGTRVRDEKMHHWLAGHGYACVRLDIRGTGDSEGILADEYSVQEQLDGVAAIAWLAAQDWCDGQVAMIGISWGGFNGLQIAARQPPALKTVITVGSTDDRYATDVHYVGGCLSKDNMDWSATMFASQDLPPDPALVGPAWRQMWRQRQEANVPWILTWLAHQRRDAYWKQGSVCEDFAAIRVPVYAVSGWADNYSESVPRLMAGLSVPRRGLIGPWAHSYPHDVAVEPAIGWLQEVVRWCDHWLKGRDTGIMKEPLLRVWMQDSVPPSTCYTHRAGRWVGETEWPSPRIRDVTLHPAPGGRLADVASTGQASVASPLWVGLSAGEVGRYGQDAEWPGDQREDDGGSLVFTSEPLSDRLEILGAPRLRLRVSADKPQALVAVRLNDVAPDGASTRVSLGLLNLSHRDSHEDAKPLTPGAIFDCVVELDDIAHAFPPGHRIAVSLSTSYWPIAWPSPELARLTVAFAGTALVLPTRPPRAEDAGLRPFEPAEHAPPTPHIDHPVPGASRRTVTRDLLSGEMVVNFPRWTYRQELTDIATLSEGEGFARYRIIDGDPLSATCETGYRVALTRSGVTVGHESSGRLTADATHFRVEQSLTVTEDGKTVFTRHWDERIPRDQI